MTNDASVMHPNKRNFVEGLGLIFDRWVALQMAVEMGWGGHDAVSKAEEFKASLIEYFDRGKCRLRETYESRDLMIYRHF